MRSITRAALVGAAALPLAAPALALASASTAADVSFAYIASGSTVTNTIINNSGVPLQCGTLLGDAPGECCRRSRTRCERAKRLERPARFPPGQQLRT
ncbi:hypothetical protein [Rhodococcus qingshengii]|uniref:hypothetical protein n=1 Tax=Rhodococcus qingshengii TaxID=334542 RepID=UPI001EE744E6|nr:hypothetical protein [Rhodococcus qingshengii]